MKITFKVDHTPKGQAPDRPSYKAGTTYDFSGPVGESYARKYLAHGLADPAAVAEIAPAPQDESREPSVAPSRSAPAAKPADESPTEDPVEGAMDGAELRPAGKKGRGGR